MARAPELAAKRGSVLLLGLQRTVMSWRRTFLPPRFVAPLLVFGYSFGFYPPALKATLASGEGHRVPS